jgi:hypothetical protein
MADARVSALSVDRRFMVIYEAALGLCNILLAAAGYQTRNSGHHAIVIKALPLLLGPEAQKTSDYLDDCRKLRHTLTYERVGLTTELDVARLTEMTSRLRERVLQWLAEHHPELLPEGLAGGEQ